jgi:DNA-binding protein HU-beta
MAGKKPLTKGQIVSKCAEKFADVDRFTKKAAAAVIDWMPELAIAETKKVGSFIFPGIGKAVLVKRKARVGRNPATGAPINIPAKTVVKIRVAKAFKDAIIPPKK